MILIKPHHFFDIIKLYGSGLDNFVPDLNFKHDFYKVGNIILKNKETILKLTIYDDDICKPCKYIDYKGTCIDKISHIAEINSKDEWNKILDKRIMKIINLSEGHEISSINFCKLLKTFNSLTFDVWIEENLETKIKRDNFFQVGIDKYLK